MEKKKLLYSGKAKDVYETDNPDLCILAYRDDATALNGLKKGSFEDKGVLNNAISAILFDLIAKSGVPTHFIEKLSQREMLAKIVKIIPLEVIIRNTAAGSFAKNFGVEEGTELKCTVLEYCLKDDSLNDPQMNEYHILALDLATREQLDQIAKYSFIINDVLSEYFLNRKIKLIDFKIEFGITNDGTLVLADEISPDSCRLWDAETNEKMDKDRFRRDMGGFAKAYQEVLKRMEG